MGFADRYDAPVGSEGIEIRNNLLYDLGKTDRGRPLLASQSLDNIVKDNVISDANRPWVEVWNNENLHFGQNTVINSASQADMHGDIPAGWSTNEIFATAAEAGYMEDYSFVTDVFTDHPREITLPNAVKPDREARLGSSITISRRIGVGA